MYHFITTILLLFFHLYSDNHLNTISNTVTPCIGGNFCCSKETPCSQWEGDCDHDDECKNGLICGSNNCPMNTAIKWDEADDCCVQGNFRYFRKPEWMRFI